MKLYYALYHNKIKMEIKIITNPSCLCDEEQITDEVKRYNDFYFVSTNRKKLKEKAENLREEWINEAYDIYNKLTCMEIKNVYNKRKDDKIKWKNA